MYIFGRNPNVESFKFNDVEQTIEIIFREESNIMYACMPPCPAPDRVWKEIYGIKDGKLCLLQTVDGKHIPAYHVEEKIEFNN